MNLLAPALLVGLLGLGLPLAAHLLGRQRPQHVPFAAMRFLPTVEPAVTHRRVLQDWPLLLVRLLILATLVVALARPTRQEPGDVAVVAAVHDAVLVFDGSRSMQLRTEDGPLFEAALERADELLRTLPAGSRIGLLTSDPDGPRLEPTADPAAVREALEAWHEAGAPGEGAWSLAETLPAAVAMLQPLGGERPRYVYAIGDRAAGGLGDLPPVAEGGIPVLAVPVPREVEDLPPHVGLVATRWDPAYEVDPQAVRIRGVVRQFGGEAAREVGVALTIEGREVARTRLTVPPDADAPVEFTHTLAEAERGVTAELRLVEHGRDPLPSDDVRHLWLAADEGLEVVVVDGDPSELRAHDEVFFFTTAIAAQDRDRRIHLRSMAPDQLEQALAQRGAKALAETDVLVLANVKAPRPDLAAAIVERVEEGMGLFLSVGDRVDSAAYNEAFGPVLPLRMRDAVQVGTAPGRAEARVEGLAPVDLSHPIFRGLQGEPGLTGTRARRIVLLEPDPRKPRSIAMSFTSGAPALLTTEVGRGRVALLTTTIDRDWADLPLRPGFVPLVAGTVAYLGGAEGSVAGTRSAVGQPRTIPTREPITVTTPTGRDVPLSPDADGNAVMRETRVPGIYRVRRDDAVQRVFVVEVDPRESETRPLDVEDARGEGGPSRAVFVSSPRWRDLVLVAALLLLLETLLRWWNQRKSAPGKQPRTLRA